MLFGRFQYVDFCRFHIFFFRILIQIWLLMIEGKFTWTRLQAASGLDLLIHDFFKNFLSTWLHYIPISFLN